MWRFLLVALVVSGCQCARLPEDLACEPDDPPCDAGADAGLLDSGALDGGALDGGALDGGALDGGALDGGPCNDWPCVLAAWEPGQLIGTPEMESFPITAPDVDGGMFGWFGGVLLPDGRVLAVAHTANSFLVFDPKTKQSAPFGPGVGETKVLSAEGRKFAGGVLVDRRVYVFPYGARHIYELNLEDGGFQPVGPEVPLPSDGGGPRYVGGVVDQHGDVWSVSEDALPVIRLDRHNLLPDGGMSVSISTLSGNFGGYWGMVRMPDDRLLAFPKEFQNDSRLSRRVLVIDPGGQTEALTHLSGFEAANGFQGASLTATGHACATPAYLGNPVCLTTTSLEPTILPVPGTTTTFGFNASGPDGRVWTAPDNQLQIWRLSPGFITGGAVSGPVARETWLGLVATPDGLVAIPGAPPHRFGLIDSPETRPMHVLLSPYFNKL